MKEVDYIIVGDGYGALFFAHQLTKNKKTFVLFSGGSKSASHISAGIINPLVLKRFTRFWLAQEQIDALRDTLTEIAEYTCEDYWIDERIHRILHDEAERDVWQKKSLRSDLTPFLSSDFETLQGVTNPFETGYVLQSGRLNVDGFFNGLFAYFSFNDMLIKEFFNYDDLNTDTNTYQNITYKKIVFAEGMAVKNNPYFKSIPLIPNKGHQLNLQLSKNLGQKSLKKKYFLFPMSSGQFYYGGTHDRDHLQKEINQDSVEDLKNSLEDFYNYGYEITTINYAFRPTVQDRRPIIGKHQLFGDLYVLNGLGARGILNGNYFAKDLYEFIENGTALLDEVNIDRFLKL